MTDGDYSVLTSIEALGYDASNPPYPVHRACVLLINGGVGSLKEIELAQEFADELDVECAPISRRSVWVEWDGYVDEDGYGNGYGDGYGYGDGNGDGDGEGLGYGDGDGFGDDYDYDSNSDNLIWSRG